MTAPAANPPFDGPPYLNPTHQNPNQNPTHQNPPPVRDTRARAVLLIAVGMNVLFGAGLLADHLGPKLEKSGPLHGDYLPGLPWYVSDTALGVLAGWPAAVLVLLAGWIWSRTARIPRIRRTRMVGSQILASVVLLAPFTIFILGDVQANARPAALLALPSTAFALWAVYRMQRHYRMPVRVFLFPFAWGLLALGFGGSMNLLVVQIATNRLETDLLHGTDGLGQITRQLSVQHQINIATFASAGTFEELGKGIAIAIVFVVARHRLDGVVSGVVLGAGAGLGFNLGETVEYMGAGGGASAAYQYWARQSVGLMAAHVAFTAITGAAFGIAATMHSRRKQALAIGSGYLAAAGGHFCTDTAILWFGDKSRTWSVGAAVQTWVLTPAQVLGTSGLFVVLYLLLWRRGVREQARLLGPALWAEVGGGAITPSDIPVLLDPRERLRRRLIAFRVGGFAMSWRLARLQNAQLELATFTGHRMRGRFDPTAPPPELLRRRIFALRYGVSTVPAYPQAVPA